MSETESLISDSRTPPQPPSEPSSGGVMLRLARESQGLSIEALASVLKVPVSKLEALESDRLDLLPDVFFARALASSVCRSLKIDSVAILGMFPSSSLSPMKTDESGINTPFRVPGERVGLGWLAVLRKPFVLAVVFLLVGALVLFLLPSVSLPDLIGAQEAEPGEVISAPVAVLPMTTEVLTAAMPPLEATSSASAPVAVNEGVGVIEASSRVEVSPLPVTVSGSGSVAGIVVLKARGATWVEVVDASGGVQLRKILGEGETVGVSGALPLSVVIGRADLVAVEVRGKSMDVAPFAKNNIARFEVK